MYDLDGDDKISKDELLSVLHMMVGANISEEQVMTLNSFLFTHLSPTFFCWLFVYCMSVFIAVFVLAGQHCGQDNQWGRHRRRQPDLIWGVCTGQSQFDNVVYKTEYLSHLELFLPECSILVVSLLFWNDPALMILMIQLSTQEASLKEIENVWTVFQNWKTGFGVHVNIVLKFIWPLIQRCLLVLFRRWREWMWSRRWASVSCTDSALSVLLPDSTPPSEVDTNYTLLHCHADKLSGFLTPVNVLVFIVQICFVLLLRVAYSSFIATGQNFMPI